MWSEEGHGNTPTSTSICTPPPCHEYYYPSPSPRMEGAQVNLPMVCTSCTRRLEYIPLIFNFIGILFLFSGQVQHLFT